jgi:hypothetical protein
MENLVFILFLLMEEVSVITPYEIAFFFFALVR